MYDSNDAAADASLDRFYESFEKVMDDLLDEYKAEVMTKGMAMNPTEAVEFLAIVTGRLEDDIDEMVDIRSARPSR